MPRVPKFIPYKGGVGGAFIDPIARLSQLSQQYAASPAFWGTGTATGLGRGDSLGWRQMLDDEQEYMQLSNLVQGKKAPTIEYGGTIGSPLMDEEINPMATGERNPLSGGVYKGRAVGAKGTHGRLKALQALDKQAGY